MSAKLFNQICLLLIVVNKVNSFLIQSFSRAINNFLSLAIEIENNANVNSITIYSYHCFKELLIIFVRFVTFN